MDALITRRSGGSSSGSSEYNGKFDYSIYAVTPGAGHINSFLTDINLKEFDTSDMISMGSMFKDCLSLRSLDLSSFDTSNVTDTEDMFANCNALKTLYVRSETDKNKLTASTTKLPSTCKVIVGKPS